jgi:hypothetical protein
LYYYIFSGGDAEYPLDEAFRSNDVAFRQPANLTFANDVHCLVSRDAAQCAACRAKPLARYYSLLDEAVILLNHVVHVLRWPAPALSAQYARLLQSAIADA